MNAIINFAGSVVTKTDKAVDTLLREELAKITPEAGFFTEETDENTIQEYNWIIDPIDGTANFANKIPIFGTIISLWRDNEPQIGLISFPTFGEVILSVKGQGVTINGKKVIYKKGLPNKTPYSSIGFVGSDKDEAEFLEKLDGIVSSPANFYCSAMNMGLAATQRADVSIVMNLSLWDIAGGIAIAQEAGLGVEFLSGWPDVKNDLRKYNHQVIIGENDLVKKIVERIKAD